MSFDLNKRTFLLENYTDHARAFMFIPNWSAKDVLQFCVYASQIDSI